MANSPSSVITIEMTAASTGRRMKKYLTSGCPPPISMLPPLAGA
jgi:hypothetical protein